MADDILKLIGLRIRELRKESGLSQEQLGEIVGFHYTYIGAIERAEKNISILNLEKIASALKVGVYELFVYAKQKHKQKDKSKDIDKILELLHSLSTDDVKKAKNVLSEMFS
jgi:transcriptional regulator with XRE-family HTH domain